MSSKRKRNEGKSGESVEKAEEIFQAVILSDSFNFRFLPITLETPRVSKFENHVSTQLSALTSGRRHRICKTTRVLFSLL